MTARHYFLIFLLALIVRAAYLSTVWQGSFVTADSAAYIDLAAQLRAAAPYDTPHAAGPGSFPADLQRPPGYPALLVVLPPSARIIAVAQSLLCAAFAVILALITTRLFGQRAGTIAGLLYATDATTIIHGALVMADAIVALPLTLSVCAVVRYWRAPHWLYPAIAGLLLGVAALIKPSVIMLLPLLVVACLFQHPRRYALATLSTCLLFVVPWMVRNYQRHGLFTLSEIGTTALYFYTAHGGSGNSPASVAAAVDVEAARWETLHLSPVERRAAMRAQAWQIIKDQPLKTAINAMRGLARSLFGTGRETWRREARDVPWWAHTALPFLLNLSMIVFAGAGMWRLWRAGQKREALLLALAIALILLPAAAPNGYSRFRTLAIPLLALSAGVGVAAIKWPSRQARFWPQLHRIGLRTRGHKLHNR